MVESWKAENLKKQQDKAALRFFCPACSTLRAQEDAFCGDCGQTRPEDGWKALDQAFDPFLGRILQDRYLIDKIEGRGTSSTVYRAKSLNVPKRFAIKMVRLAHSDPAVAKQAQTRLEREVRAVGMLRSPHIVRVYEMLEVAPQWVAVVMEHIDGQTVEQRIKERGPMKLDEACRLLLQVANGLCEAHQNGMVHRDIKPANLMLEQLPDGRPFAYLLDFGVVQIKGETGMTQGFLGTPLFTSPEQAGTEVIDPSRPLLHEQAEPPIDARSDIYSLGATFYYMLTGRAPFEHSDAVKLLHAHLQQPAPTLAEGCPAAEFPAAIEKLVARMLAKSRDERPANLFRVIDALQAYQADRHAPTSGLVSSASELAPNTVAVEDAADEVSSAEDKQAQRSFKNASKRPHYDSGNFVGSSTASDSQPRSLLPKERPRHQTQPPGIQPPPQTNPRGATSTTLERLEQRTINGHPFARNIRASGVGTAGHLGFVDSHNEVWSIQDGALSPHCTPTSRVCSLSTSDHDLFVGLKDASIHRVRPNSRELEQLLPADNTAANASIDALSTTPAGHLLLAGTAAGQLLIGRRAAAHSAAQPAGFAWQSVQTSHPIAALALSPDGELFAVSRDRSVHIAAPGKPGITLTQFDTAARIIDIAFSTGGDLLAVLLETPDLTHARVQVFQVLHARKISEFAVPAPRPRNLYFSAHNMLHGICASHGRIGSWNMMSSRSASPHSEAP